MSDHGRQVVFRGGMKVTFGLIQFNSVSFGPTVWKAKVANLPNQANSINI